MGFVILLICSLVSAVVSACIAHRTQRELEDAMEKLHLAEGTIDLLTAQATRYEARMVELHRKLTRKGLGKKGSKRK